MLNITTTSKNYTEAGPSSPTGMPCLRSFDLEHTSTFQYLNSQLVAHGFASAPGLCLDGLANDDSERLSKCLLGMLSQRMVRYAVCRPRGAMAK